MLRSLVSGSFGTVAMKIIVSHNETLENRIWASAGNKKLTCLSQGGSFPGQLTTLGMQQLYELGKTLRTRYMEEKHFLSPAFSLAEV